VSKSEHDATTADVSPTETSSRSRSRSKGAICYEYDEDDATRRIRVANDQYPDLDSITAGEPDAREFADRLPQLPLPGSGEEYGDCGEEFPSWLCSDRGCGAVYRTGRTCRRSRCPRCWKSWDFHTSSTVAAKADGRRRKEYSDSEGRMSPKLHHVTVSLPNSTRFDSGDPLGRGFDLAKLLLAQVDAHAGYLIYHPWRIAADHRGDVLGHSSGEGDLTWKDVLGLIDSEGWDTVREEYLTYAPHFHAICVSEFVQGGAVTDALEDKTGVVIHRITPEDDSAVSIGDMEGLCKVSAYSLSHAGIAQDEENDARRAAYRPFGAVANTEVRENVEMEAKDALRSVSGTVLGLDFPEPTCSEHRLDEAAPSPDEGSPAAGVDRPPVRVLTDGGDSGSGSSGSARNTGFADSSGSGEFADEGGAWDAPESTSGAPVPPSINEPDESLTSPCGGQLVPMSAADDYLRDNDWMASLTDSARSQLREAHAEFLALDGGEDLKAPPPD
jgi:hypothetical protein